LYFTFYNRIFKPVESLRFSFIWKSIFECFNINFRKWCIILLEIAICSIIFSAILYERFDFVLGIQILFDNFMILVVNLLIIRSLFDFLEITFFKWDCSFIWISYFITKTKTINFKLSFFISFIFRYWLFFFLSFSTILDCLYQNFNCCILHISFTIFIHYEFYENRTNWPV
jgi:hypothetical protein